VFWFTWGSSSRGTSARALGSAMSKSLTRKNKRRPLSPLRKDCAMECCARIHNRCKRGNEFQKDQHRYVLAKKLTGRDDVAGQEPRVYNFPQRP
jgi:hypothetical protein